MEHNTVHLFFASSCTALKKKVKKLTFNSVLYNTLGVKKMQKCFRKMCVSEHVLYVFLRLEVNFEAYVIASQ